MKKITILLLITIVAIVIFSSGCLGKSVSFTISTTTMQTITVTSTISSTSTIYVTTRVFETKSITDTTLLTSAKTVVTTSTTVFTKIENSTAVIAYYSIIKVPVDYDGFPNKITYKPIDNYEIIITGLSNFTVYYWNSLAADPYVLPLFSYIDELYYSKHDFSKVMNLNKTELLDYVANVYLETPDIIDDPYSYILSTKIPINIYYDIFALNALFNSKQLEYIYFDGGVAIRSDDFIIDSSRLYGNMAAFYFAHKGTVMTIVSFETGVPRATIFFTFPTVTTAINRFFPAIASFSGSYYNEFTTIIVSGYHSYTSWVITMTGISKTVTTTDTIEYFDNTIIVNNNTSKLRYEVFEEKYVPVFCNEDNLYYIDNTMAIITMSTHFVTMKNKNITGYFTGTYILSTSEQIP